MDVQILHSALRTMEARALAQVLGRWLSGNCRPVSFSAESEEVHKYLSLPTSSTDCGRVVLLDGRSSLWDSIRLIAFSGCGTFSCRAVAHRRVPLTLSDGYPHVLVSDVVSVASLVRWIFEEKDPSAAMEMTQSDILAAQAVCLMDWHGLKYRLHKFRSDGRWEARLFGQFLEHYPKARLVHDLLQKDGDMVYEFGMDLKKRHLDADHIEVTWKCWREDYRGLVDAVESLSVLQMKG